MIRELGRGGMGVVYEAEDPAVGRRVAIKLLLGHGFDPLDLERFRREAEILAQVEHPHVVRVHDMGQIAQGPYLVTELIDGVEPVGPLPVQDAVRITLQIADAVQALHDHGCVHRDLKPSNVLVQPDGHAVLLDFGLARELDGKSLTQSGAVVGSPATMSPEQALGEAVGPLADVHGLGGLLFTLLTGRPPFEGKGLLDLLNRVATAPPRSPSELVPQVPEALDAVCLRALAKAPEARHMSARAFALDLARATSSSSQRVGLWAALAGVCLVALGAVAWGSRSPQSTPSGPPAVSATTPAALPSATPTPTPTPTRARIKPWGQPMSETRRERWVRLRFMGNTHLVVTGTKTKLVRVFDLATRAQTRAAQLKEPCEGISADPDGQFVLLSGRERVRIVEATRIALLGGMQRFEQREQQSRVLVLPERQFVLAKRRRLSLWVLKGNKAAALLADLGEHSPTNLVGALALHPDGNLLVSGSSHFPENEQDNVVSFWDVRARERVLVPPWDWVREASAPVLRLHGEAVSLVWSTPATLVVCAYGGAAQVLDSAARQARVLPSVSKGPIAWRMRRARRDARGRVWLLWGAPAQPRGELHRWDPGSGALTLVQAFHDRGPSDFDLSPDGGLLAMGFRTGTFEVRSAPQD